MFDAKDVRSVLRRAPVALKELSSLAGSVGADLPALLRRCFCYLPYLDAGDKGLATLCRCQLFGSLCSVLSRDPSPSLLPAIEVFIENLVFDTRLSGFFNDRYIYATIGAPQCPPDFHTVLELVCNHFISSLEGKGGFQAFLSALSWSGNELQGPPEISLREALSLINTTHQFSMPGVVRAHLLLLASRCVSGPDPRSHLLAIEHRMNLHMDYLPPFECCMNLYVAYLPALGIFSRTGGVRMRTQAEKRPLTCCIKQLTHQKLENKVDGLLSFFQAHIGGDMPISDSGIFNISDRLIEKNHHLLHGEYRQQATLLLMSILTKILCCAKQNEVHESDAEMTEEVICLAAVLRLMGSLLAQILNHLGQMRADDHSNNANHIKHCSEYSILCSMIRLFGQYEANELHRCDVIGTIPQPLDRESASMQMLAHFASLSVFCARRRLGFLWRLCIVMMMMAMNLVILEIESMDNFHLLIDAAKESSDIPDTHKGNLSLALTPKTDNDSLQVYVPRRSSIVIASRWTALQNQSDEKVNGRDFIRCHPDYKPSWNDIEDYLECKKDKDYSHYLEQRKKFNAFTMGKFVSQNNTNKRKLKDLLCIKSSRHLMLAGS